MSTYSGEDNDSTPECSYSLRSKIHFLTDQTKQQEEQNGKNKRRCPSMQHKRSLSENVQSCAWPLGQRGHLSPHYNPSLGTPYLEQLYYQIDKTGEGSFGSVYRYRSREDGRCYALKFIKRYSKSDKFWEVKALDIILDNPYCVQYSNAWFEKDMLHIQFELGIMSVAEYSHKNHDICEEECLDIVFDVLKALELLHKENWVHMDIKPDNIIITYDKKYKLCDFGLLTKSGNKSPFNGSEGDAKYMAKEVLAGEISPAADIFSLGITLIELHMDLVLPVFGSWWHNLRKCKWRLPSPKLNKRVSDYIVTLINWMMEWNPKSRPTVEELLRLPYFLKRSRAKKERVDHFGKWRALNEDQINDVVEVIEDPIQLDFLNKTISGFDKEFPNEYAVKSPTQENLYSVPNFMDGGNNVPFNLDMNPGAEPLTIGEINWTNKDDDMDTADFDSDVIEGGNGKRKPLENLSPNKSFTYDGRNLNLPIEKSNSAKGAARVLQLSPQPGPSNVF